MISGYVLRNGQYGTSNLTANGRTTIPAMGGASCSASVRTNPDRASAAVIRSAATWRTTITSAITAIVQGVDFDLDEYNGRWCVTPEFPNGTYAYFVSISSNGTPMFPYNIGRALLWQRHRRQRSRSIAETVDTNFVGGPNGAFSLGTPVQQESERLRSPGVRWMAARIRWSPPPI